MVKVFSEIKRVLKDEGTCWLNLGDTYSSHKDDKSRAQTIAIGTKSERAHVIEKGRSVSRNTKALKAVGLKNKDLVGIPWCVALALQDDGWYLRQDIIWSKPNPMPESVTDRCTKAHEYIFLLTKSPRYYFDSESIKEKTVTRDKTVRDRDTTRLNNTPGRTRMGGLTTNNYEMRNKRSVWTVNTKPFKEAHFAVFPTELIVPMVKAGCPPGGVVLDPFFGSGTTGLVAKRLNRKYIGVELNPEYIKIAEKRLAQEVLL
jgi:DNA modification methylase